MVSDLLTLQRRLAAGDRHTAAAFTVDVDSPDEIAVSEFAIGTGAPARAPS